MTRPAATTKPLAAAAALARIEEVAAQMVNEQITAEPTVLDDPKALARSMWAQGDYHTFALETIWEVGAVMVQACRVAAGQRVLDVAAGTGNVAIRAAEAGADVVASDLTPENFAAGRREAAARGVELEWVEGDAEALPFGDAEFDVVTSVFGAMFAPDHQAVADELVRVCRPRGTIGLASFTPGGLGGEFFGVLGAHMPPPPKDALQPVLWGTEDHVRHLFADRVDTMEVSRLQYVERASSPRAYFDLFARTFGPVVALRSSLASATDRLEELDRDLFDFAMRANRGEPGGPALYPYEYLLVVAKTRDE